MVEQSNQIQIDEPENPICGKFPNQKMCGCTIPCRKSMQEVKITLVSPNLYIGPLEASFCTHKLVEMGITHIVNASNSKYFKRKYFKYLDIPCEDSQFENIEQYFGKCNKFIQEAITNGGSAFVHCVAGRSRSPTIILAYLISQLNLQLQDGLALFEQLNLKLSINEGFLEQLKDYEAQQIR